MNYKDILKKLQEYYANLLIVQYNSKPKAKATIEKLTSLIYADMILLKIQNAFDWRTAVGKQLDIIGQWVGVSRSYNINLITKSKLAYLEYSKLVPRVINSALQGGYSDYETFGDNNGGQLRYSDLQLVTNELNDDAYRVIIGLKIIYNNINHTAGEIDKAIFGYFGQYLYTKDYPTTSTSSLAYYRFYTDEKFQNLFGVVYPNAFDHYQGEAGYYRFFRTNSTEVIAQKYCQAIEHVKGKLYRLQYGVVYTSWDMVNNPHEIIYYYPEDYAEIIQVAEYKGVLPAPIGTNINTIQY